MMNSISVQIYEVRDQGEGFHNCDVTFESPAKKDLIDRIIKAVGEKVHDAMKVEVSFTDLLAEANLPESSWWKSSSSNLVSVPLGPRGANDIQTLAFGTGLSHHGIIIGRPGSGKTNLMHVIITAISLKYSPLELHLYLIDFKKGVGFKAYADYSLPHAKVIAIESEREFGISVLRSLDKELAVRGELFRNAGGVEKISEYRERTSEKMPRLVLIADEFQEFFTVEDAISREASLLFDRLARQGRAFGIHMLLGTQTLAGSYGMNRSTLDQMSIRIALQCSEADCRLILGDDNPGAKFLSRPGEAIYNAENGLVQANKLFQVAIFQEEDKIQYLDKIRDECPKPQKHHKPIVFEGHLPSKMDKSDAIDDLIVADKHNRKHGVNAWLGEPIAIKEATHARFRQQAGSNLVIVTRDEEQGMGIISGALMSLAIQFPDDACRFVIVDYSSADSDWSNYMTIFAEEIPHESIVIRGRQVVNSVKEILQEVENRQERNTGQKSILFFVIIGLQRARMLRKDEDDYSKDSPADQLMKILGEGPEVGVHCIFWVDTVPTITKTIGRNALKEFGMRVAGVMSDNDSQNLLDDSSASKIDRPHRMLFFDEEQPGVLEKFRPFAIPPLEWIKQTANKMKEI